MFMPVVAEAQASTDDLAAKLTEVAYQGITFNELYGSNLAKPHQGIRMGAFFDILRTRVDTELNQATDQAYKDLCQKVMDALNPLVSFLNTESAPSGSYPNLKDYPFSSLFCTDLPHHPHAAIKDLLKKMAAVETAGLTIPCNLVHSRGKHKEFQDLVRSESFWRLLGPLEYYDFFTTPMDDADNDLIEVTQQALEVGLFGAMHYHKTISDTQFEKVVKDSADGDQAYAKVMEGVKAINSCCNQATQQCQSDGNPAHNCTMCNGKCCLGSYKCPL